MQGEFKALTLNMHKGFSANNLRYTLEALRVALRDSGCTLVFLQEVSGESRRYRKRLSGWPNTDQLEFLADAVWPHFAYGKNAVTTNGHHGNAIMSAVPIARWHNEDLSLHRVSQRGLLHVTLESGFELISVHLGLFERERHAQLSKLIDYIKEKIDPDAPLLLAGDFNDWRQLSHRRLKQQLGVEEAFEYRTGKLAKSFPATLPLLQMDRLYFRGIRIESVSRPNDPLWRRLSDHSALVADCRSKPRV
jgi:endonuclease/exonuclease/phosphatase family metal-dependent hydrolase